MRVTVAALASMLILEMAMLCFQWVEGCDTWFVFWRDDPVRGNQN